MAPGRNWGARAALLAGLGISAAAVAALGGWDGEGSSLRATPSASRRLLSNYPDDAFSISDMRNGAVVLHVIGVLYMFVALAIVCDDYFVPALERLIESIGVPDDVAGATFMAAGGSAPELFTSFIGVFISKSNVGFGTIVGSAVFNILFVIGACAFASPKPLELTWWPLFRDSTYYALSLAMLAVFFGVSTKDRIQWWESLTLLLMYGVYSLMMKYNTQLQAFVTRCGSRWCNRKGNQARVSIASKGELSDDSVEEGGATEAVPGDGRASDAASICADDDAAGDESDARPSDINAKVWGSDKAADDDEQKGDDLPLQSAEGEAANDTHHSVAAAAAFSGGDSDGHQGGGQEGPASDEEDERGVSSGDESNDAPPRNMRASYHVGVIRQLLADDLHDVDEAFEAFRVGQKVHRDELRQVLARLGTEPDPDDVERAFEELTTLQLQRNASAPVRRGLTRQASEALITKDTFKHWYRVSDFLLIAEAHQEFVKADLDGNGSIDEEEFKHLMHRILEKPPTDEELSAQFKVIDESKDGRICFSEFKNWYRKAPYLRVAKNEARAATHVGELKTAKQKVIYVLLFPINFLLGWTIPDVSKDRLAKYFAFSFAMSIVWIAIFSYFMVWWATRVGQAIDVPDEVMGLTFLAAGTSVPDLLSSLIVALQGRGDQAVSSSIGSNIFDVLVGLPLPWFIYAIGNGGEIDVSSGDTLFVSVLVLFGMLVATISAIAIYGWKMTKAFGVAMFILYVLFVTQDLLRVYNVF